MTLCGSGESSEASRMRARLKRTPTFSFPGCSTRCAKTSLDSCRGYVLGWEALLAIATKSGKERDEGAAQRKRRQDDPGGAKGRAMVWNLPRDPIAALLVVGAEGLDLQRELLDQRSADETTNRVRLPRGQLHDFRECRTLGTAHQGLDFGFFRALASDVGRFLRRRARRVASFGLGGGPSSPSAWRARRRAPVAQPW